MATKSFFKSLLNFKHLKTVLISILTILLIVLVFAIYCLINWPGPGIMTINDKIRNFQSISATNNFECEDVKLISFSVDNSVNAACGESLKDDASLTELQPLGNMAKLITVLAIEKDVLSKGEFFNTEYTPLNSQNETPVSKAKVLAKQFKADYPDELRELALVQFGDISNYKDKVKDLLTSEIGVLENSFIIGDDPSGIDNKTKTTFATYDKVVKFYHSTSTLPFELQSEIGKLDTPENNDDKPLNGSAEIDPNNPFSNNTILDVTIPNILSSDGCVFTDDILNHEHSIKGFVLNSVSPTDQMTKIGEELDLYSSNIKETIVVAKNNVIASVNFQKGKNYDIYAVDDVRLTNYPSSKTITINSDKSELSNENSDDLSNIHSSESPNEQSFDQNDMPFDEDGSINIEINKKQNVKGKFNEPCGEKSSWNFIANILQYINKPYCEQP